ncbi:MAG TPA: hypothetical protein VNJ28_06550, partial [Candidatus Limnocylindrales bacterium]|nr:hypothetical protein [Candidatus Limnocylindrales bacterium]
EPVAQARNLGRRRVVDPAVVGRHARLLERALASGRLFRQGFAAVHVLATPEAVDRVRIVRVPWAGEATADDRRDPGEEP